MPSPQDLPAPSQTIAHRPISTPMLVLVFAVTVPLFFLAGFLALALIQTEVWLNGSGKIVAARSAVISATEAGIIAHLIPSDTETPADPTAALPIGGGAVVAEGTELVRLQSTALHDESERLQIAIDNGQAELVVLNARLSALQAQPTDTSVLDIDLAELRNAEQQTWMQERLRNAENTFEKGAMSLRDITDIRWSLRQLEIDAEVTARRHQHARDLSEEHTQRIAVARAEIAAAETRLHGLSQQQTNIAQRLSALSLRAPFPSQLVWKRDWHVGDQIAAGTPLATAHGVGPRQLAVEVSEDVFVHIQLGARIRFTTAVVSVYKYDYYWGEVSDRRVVTDAAGVYHYELTTTLNPSDHALPLNQLPLGSGGRVDIGVGRKRLLAQLVGW